MWKRIGCCVLCAVCCASPATAIAIPWDPVKSGLEFCLDQAITIIDEGTSTWTALAFGYATFDPQADLQFTIGGLGEVAKAQETDHDPAVTQMVGPFTDIGDCYTRVKRSAGLVGSHTMDPLGASFGRFHNICQVYKDGRLVDELDGTPPPANGLVTGIMLKVKPVGKKGTRGRVRMVVNAGVASPAAPFGPTMSVATMDYRVVLQAGVEFDPDSLKWIPWQLPTTNVGEPTLEAAYTFTDLVSRRPSLRTMALAAVADSPRDGTQQLVEALNADTYTDVGNVRVFDEASVLVSLPEPIPVYDETGDPQSWFESTEVEAEDKVGDWSWLPVGVEEATRHNEPSLRVLTNPIRSVLTIIASVPSSTNVRLSLHDLTGREIQLLDSSVWPAGQRTIIRALPENLSAGIVFVQLTTDQARLGRKVAVVH
jgi:hypothetical protein